MYSPNELVQYRRDLETYLDSEKEYPFKLVYATKKNINTINSELEEFSETLDSDAEGFAEFQEARFKAAVDAGGAVETLRTGGQRISNPEDIDEEKFQESLDKLTEEYADVIKEQEEIERKKREKANEEVIKIDWYYLKPEFFPENITPKELPNKIIDLIKETE